MSLRAVAAQLVLLAALVQPAPADTAAGAVVPLFHGMNALDILGDGTRGQVFVAWRGNYNAHGFRVVTFYVLAKSDLGGDRAIWQDVPFFGGPNDGPAGREVFRTAVQAKRPYCDVNEAFQSELALGKAGAGRSATGATR